MMRSIVLCTVLASATFAPMAVIAQEAPREVPAVKEFESYDKLFDDFDQRRKVLITKFERLQQKERVEPEELRKAEGELVSLDREYAASLRLYIDKHENAKDRMPARFELAITLSRLEDKLAEAVTACDEFLKHHADADLVADVRFVRAQTLFRMPGREDDALLAFELFLEKHSDRQEADAARMMRIRTLMFLNRVGDAKRSLEVLIKSDRVKENAEAKAFLQVQLDALDWVGRDLPAFELKDTAGNTLSAAALQGKPVLLFVWDTTSAACLGELPFVQELHKRHGEKFHVVGISVNESQAAFEQWLARNPDAIKFRSTWIDREQENTLVKKLAISVIPFNVLVDAAGKVYRYDVRSDDLLRYAEKLAK